MVPIGTVLPIQYQLPFRMTAGGATHRGRRREHNEDAVLVRDDLMLYAVADGAGGHNAGDVASALAVRSLSNYVGATDPAARERPEFDRFGFAFGARRLSAAIQKANHDIIAVSQENNKYRGMGTTLTTALVTPRCGLMHIGHVGDSRCYRLRNGLLESLTHDDSLLNEILARAPLIDDAVIEGLPKRIVTRALGMHKHLRVSIRSYEVLPGDRYLLCTDGLSGEVSERDIRHTLGNMDPPDQTVGRLISMANDAGGYDNIAAVVMDCTPGDPGVVPEARPSFISAPDEVEGSHPEILVLGVEEAVIGTSADVDSGPDGSGKDGLIEAIDAVFGRNRD